LISKALFNEISKNKLFLTNLERLFERVESKRNTVIEKK